MTCPLVGSSSALKEVLGAIALVAPVDSAVLLVGETGTGNELIARAIHDAGPRRHQRFVAVNCAAIRQGCSRASYSVMSGARLPARLHKVLEDSRRPTVAPCFSTRSEI